MREIDIKRLNTDQLYPHRQVIRFNSTFVEVMDSWEFIRGRATALALPMWGVLILGIFVCLYGLYKVILAQEYLLVVGLGIFIPGILYLIYSNYQMAKYDLFGYTHYPIRFNRKTQKVYAFSPQRQKIIELDWQDLRFSAVQEGRFDIELRASLVNSENIVEEEIILPYVSFDDHNVIDQHLAFFKAYMQGDDLEKIDAVIPEFFDVYSRKETFKESFERVYMVNDVLNELAMQTRPTKKDISGVSMMASIWFLTILVRRLGILFSKIPQWPAHIEKECEVAIDDPYDSRRQKRHLDPLVFSFSEKVILFIGWFIGTSIFIAFLAGLAYLSWNAR
nr:DUF6708 domain-containing protein [Acinetobacter sp. YH12239]